MNVCIRHQEPMVRGCFSFQIVNQYHQAVIHAFAYNPDIHFGARSGEFSLICRFPAIRLNVGRYYLRMYLTEPPGGEVYDLLMEYAISRLFALMKLFCGDGDRMLVLTTSNGLGQKVILAA